MARAGWSNTDFLNVTNNPFGTTAYPFTFACRFYPTSVGATQYMVYLTNNAQSDLFALSLGNTSKLRANVAGAGSGNYSESGAVVTANAWHTAVGVFTSTTSRTVYLDGVAGATDTVARSPSLAQTKVFVGVQNGGNPFSGRIAEVAMWNTGLTADDVASFNAGFSPLLIRPQSLIEYWPLFGAASPEPSLRNASNALSLTGAPSAASHPRVYAAA